MRLVVQRVSKASVSIKERNNTVGNIENGLMVLVGIKKGDTQQQAEYLAEKLMKLRIMSDESDKMNMNISEANGALLVISQFTLHANTKDGNRPSFIEAAPSEEAKDVYEHFVTLLQKSGVQVQTGAFGEYMHIDMILDGPVTILLER